MLEGAVSLVRSLSDHPLWRKDPFTYGQAWVDLLLLANDQDNRALVGQVFVDVPRGSLAWSERGLASRWKWTRTKVNRFLSLLKSDGMIDRVMDGNTTTIRIENYPVYNPLLGSDGTTFEPPVDHLGTTFGQRWNHF